MGEKDIDVNLDVNVSFLSGEQEGDGEAAKKSRLIWA